MDFLNKRLEINKYILEPISIKHAENLFLLLQAKELYTFIPNDAPESLNSLEKRYQKLEERYSPNKKEIWLNYAIFDQQAKLYKGTLQATIINKNKNYIAYEVFPQYWRQGIAKECVSAFINIIFKEFQSNKISAYIDTRNTASIKLLESLNFKCIDEIKNADFFKNSNSDEFVYQLKNNH